MRPAYIPDNMHSTVLDKLEAVVAALTPGDLDLRFRLAEALGEAGIWPSCVQADEELPAGAMELA